MSKKVICPYCDSPAKLVDDSEVYGRSYGKKLWMCFSCDAYVGTHSNSSKNKPLGKMANKELRYWRVEAHKSFDPLWSDGESRNDCYSWLSSKLGIDKNKCHISMFDIDTCKMVVDIC